MTSVRTGEKAAANLENTRVRAPFDKPGLVVWHCHIVEHEDHEMMRPFRVLDA